MEATEDFDSESRIGTYTEELENGIFSMVISLCQQKATEIGIEEAKQQTIAFLEKLITGLTIKEEQGKETT